MRDTQRVVLIGTHTFKLEVRRWDPAREDWDYFHYSSHRNYDAAFNEMLRHAGDAADITRTRWDEDVFTDDEYGTIRDAEGVDLERWYFGLVDGTWRLDDREQL